MVKKIHLLVGCLKELPSSTVNYMHYFYNVLGNDIGSPSLTAALTNDMQSAHSSSPSTAPKYIVKTQHLEDWQVPAHYKRLYLTEEEIEYINVSIS